MRVVLLERVANLGGLGDIVDVKNGYARNFLIPFGKAKRATEINLKEFEIKRAEYERLQTDILDNAKYRHSKIDAQVFTIVAKAGVDGKLFGSVNSFDIVNAVKQTGIEIKKSEVMLPNGHFKTIGEFDVTIMLHHDIKAVIKLNIVPEA